MGAALAAGKGAAISHTSAASVHRFRGIKAEHPEITVPMSRAPSLDGVVVHRSRCLPDDDLQTKRNVLVTRPIRTLIDLAGRYDEDLLAKVIDEGAIDGIWTPEAIGERLDELGSKGRLGVDRLRSLLESRRGEQRPDSALHQRVIRVLNAAAGRGEIPPFKIHHQLVLDGRALDIDVAWPQPWLRIAGEADGFEVRSKSRTKFDHSQEKVNLLVKHGWRPISFIWTMTDTDLVERVKALAA